MVKEDIVKSLLGAALVWAGGQVRLDRVEALLREKFDMELPLVSNEATLEKYLAANFSDICRLKKAADGHLVVRVSSD